MTPPTYYIEKIVHGGLGLCRDEDGRVVLIEGAMAGETVEGRLRAGGKKVLHGVARRIREPSPGRVQPPCPHYHQCGGCNFQHMSYPFQLDAKKGIVRDLLMRSGHPLLRQAADRLLGEPLPSPKQFHYRQRIRLQVDDRQVPGFYKARSHECIAIDQCLLARHEINMALQGLNSQPSFHRLLPQTAALEILFDPHTALATLLFHLKRKPRPADEGYGRELLSAVTEVKNLFFMGEDFAASGRDSLSYTLPTIPPHTDRALTLSLETGGFCQVNLEQNEILVKTVLDFCKIQQNETVLDLFCGMGNFSIPLAEKAGSLLGIEGQGSAIRSARKNSAAAGQENTKFIKSPLHQACVGLEEERRSFDCVLIDPPRQGAPGLAPTLAALCRKRLVYVSCDPATLCRDLGQLLDQGFGLITIQPIDMFPQTHHVETVVLLER